MSTFAQEAYTILASLLVGGFITLFIWPMVWAMWDGITTEPESQGSIIERDKSEL